MASLARQVSTAKKKKKNLKLHKLQFSLFAMIFRVQMNVTKHTWPSGTSGCQYLGLEEWGEPQNCCVLTPEKQLWPQRLYGISMKMKSFAIVKIYRYAWARVNNRQAVLILQYKASKFKTSSSSFINTNYLNKYITCPWPCLIRLQR